MAGVLNPHLPFTKWRKQAFYSLRKISNIDIYDEDIKKELVAILPNISKEQANGCDEEFLEDWIQKATSYAKTLLFDFEYLCSLQMKAIDIMKNHRILSDKFDMSKIIRLPLEMERDIQSFFLPKTRLDVLICATPNIEDRLKKMTLPWLNNIVKRTIWTNVKRIQLRFSKAYRKNAILQRKCQNFYFSEICRKLAPQSKKKQHVVEIIMNILFLHNTLDDCPSNYMMQLIHKTIFKIWHSVLYIDSKYVEKKNRLSE